MVAPCLANRYLAEEGASRIRVYSGVDFTDTRKRMHEDHVVLGLSHCVWRHHIVQLEALVLF
jgi:hypothetical protein